MKKIVQSIILLGSLLILVTGCSGKQAKLVNSQEISTTDIEKISISYQTDSINFYENDSDKLRIEEYLLTDKKNQYATIQTDNSKISIKNGKRSNFWLNFGIDNSHIDVYLPQDYHKKLNIAVTSGSIKGNDPLFLQEFIGSANSGNIKLNSLNADKIQLSATSGSLKVNQIHGKETQVKCNSGSITIGNIKTPNLIGKATSGSIKIDRLKGYADLNVNSGNIKIKQAIGGAKLKATSGSIQSSFKKVNKDISVQANSGSIRLNVPQKLAFEFDGKINSGGIMTNFENSLTKNKKQKKGVIGENPKVKINTQATSGSVTVLQNEP